MEDYVIACVCLLVASTLLYICFFICIDGANMMKTTTTVSMAVTGRAMDGHVLVIGPIAATHGTIAATHGCDNAAGGSAAVQVADKVEVAAEA